MTRTPWKMHLSLWFGWQMLPLNLWNGLKIWNLVQNLNSQKILKNSVEMSKYERIFNFKPYVYPAYFRSCGHLKIVKCTGMYYKFNFKMVRTPWKMHLCMSLRFCWQMFQLNLWNGLKIWILNFGSKFELTFFLKNGVQISKYERIFNFKPTI